MAGAGISGIGVGIITAGGFLVYTGIKNVTIQDGLRQILKGEAITEGPQTRSDLSAPATTFPDLSPPVVSNGFPDLSPPLASGPAGTDLNKFLYSLGVQESGGNNYGVVNSIGAVGKYQVLKSNVPGWSKEALGHSITWQQYRDNPALQEQIVAYKVQQYYNQFHDWRKVAAAWYAGPGNANLFASTKAQSGGPSIASYVNSVVGRAGL